MFPLSLKKNIRELDRQISLLETECEYLEHEKKEAIAASNTTSKMMLSDMQNKPFVTGPCASASSYTSRILMASSKGPKMYSASCAHFRTMNEKYSEAKTPEHSPDRSGYGNSKFLKKVNKLTDFLEESPKEVPPSGCTNDGKANPDIEKSKEHEIQQKPNSPRIKEIKKSCQRSINSIIEVSESSDENTASPNSKLNSKIKEIVVEKPEEQTSKSHRERNSTKETENRNKNNSPRADIQPPEKNQFKPKNSSGKYKKHIKPPSEHGDIIDSFLDDERKGAYSDEGENKLFDGKWSSEFETRLFSRKRMLNKRRLRSARTKKNLENEILLDLNMTKEKEIQCKLGNEEKEKAEVFTNLCDSLRTLYVLNAEIQTKSSRDKINDVLNDMKNSLMKISKISPITQESNPLNIIASAKGNHIKPLEGEDISHLKRTLYGVTKFCQELANEKSVLTEELLTKTRALATYKNKEKEYLTIISNLKFSLKNLKQEAEDRIFAERDLDLLRTKLQEETKVIEALRKSHEKMQELVENYVLENDKLKAQVKISKLESEKFYVLLSGKEEEINRYKKDIESFQKQITEQLSLLRSKATENEVVHALKAISEQTTSLQTEIESNPSETTMENENFKTIVLKSFENTSVSSDENKNKKSPPPEGFKKDSPRKSIQSRESPREEKIRKELAACPTYKEDTDSETNSDRRRGLQRVLSSSKNLRSSINELLEDIRRETSEKQWSNIPCETTSLSTLISSSSEDIRGIATETKK